MQPAAHPELPTDERAVTPAPVVPTASGAAALRPVGVLRSRIDGGIWAARRQTNHDVTLPHGAKQLEIVGNLHNFRLAAGAAGTYRGGNDESDTTAPFLDSDVYKWLDGAGWELAQHPDASLMALADPMIETVGRAQRQDGYLDTFFQVLHPGREFTDLEWGHEMYVAGHLIQAAVAWKRGLGDDRLLGIAERVVGRLEAEAGPGKRELICGHPEIEMALVELYRTTGKARYLDFARVLIERRGHGLLHAGRFGPRYWQDHEPVRQAALPAGHAVRQMYLDCGVVDVAVETGDRELLGAAIRRWEAMVGSRTYLTGALGAHHRDEAIGDAFELPPDRAYAETCAAIGSTMLAWRLLLATGESRFADLIERTALNAVLAGMGSDGAHFFYSNPLMRRSCGAEVLEGAAATRRASWFPVSCCPPNIMRFLATFPDQVATVSADGVQLHQFATGSLVLPVGGRNVRVETSTDYPWNGAVHIAITDAVPADWKLAIRVPAWASSARASLSDGTTVEARSGVLELSRTWRTGDEVDLEMAMPARVTRPDPRIDAIRGTVALERGPLVYVVEDADLPEGRSVEALEVDPDPALEEVPASLPGIGAVTRLALEGRVRNDPETTVWPYGGDRPEPATSEPVSIEAIPYFAWANRPGLGMRVWLPARSKARAGE